MAKQDKQPKRTDAKTETAASIEVEAALAAESPDESTLPIGFVRDFISGKLMKATPEEVEAVQVFARRLVDDYNYPKSRITTRPQFRVRARPSGGRSRGYPVDIAVFSHERKGEDDALMLVECKRKTRKDGEKQLKLYLTMSSAQMGVWFNGKDHLYLLKRYLQDGTIGWVVLPTIPKYGQSIADIGTLKRSQLTVPTNLKAVFRDIRNHLAGNTTGITRDQALAQEIMNVLFCKIFDELDTAPDDLPEFRVAVTEDVERIHERITNLFDRVKAEYADVFVATDAISLDPDSLRYVVGELQNYEITKASRDAIGEAFEVFIGPAVRGEEGQFFTPRNVVHMMVTLLDPNPGEMLVDPACGSGGFLIIALEHIWAKLEAEAKQKKWSASQLERKKRDVAMRCIRGLDKDGFLAKVTKAYMAIIGDGRGGIFCEDSLGEPNTWSGQAQAQVKMKLFDVVVTNPPFGSKIKVTGSHKLAQYRLAKKWTLAKRKADADWQETATYRKEQAPQILFIERCIQLLRPGGRMAIVLPESIFGMPVYGNVVHYLYESYALRAFISLPEEIFQPYTHAKTCVLILENKPPAANDKIEMAIADWCGHDSRGNPTLRTTSTGEEVLLDDVPKIAEQLRSQLTWK
ncbi:MAG: N-6 DNA methylase [Bryobacteraceae bacterium]|jgi:type I restriction enzyme M protein